MGSDRQLTLRSFLFRAVTVFLAVCLTFVFVEVIARFIPAVSTGYGYFPHFPYINDSLVGWRHAPNARVSRRAKEFRIQISTNSEGFRSKSEFLTGAPGKPVMAILGDSMVEAFQVEEDAAFPALLENRLRANGISQVQNFGVSSIGVIHYLQMYKHYARKYRPEIVVICIMDQNDIGNSAPHTDPEAKGLAPRYRHDSQGEIVGLNPFLPRERFRAETAGFSPRIFLRQHSSLFRAASLVKLRFSAQAGLVDQFPRDAFVYEEPWSGFTESAWRHAAWALEQLILEVRSDSSYALVVLLPGKWTTYDKEWQALERSYHGKNHLDRDKLRFTLRDFLTEIQADFLDLTVDFREAYASKQKPHFKVDGHFNELGHEIASDAIYDALQSYFLAETPE